MDLDQSRSLDRLRELFDAAILLSPDERRQLLECLAKESAQLYSELIELLQHDDVAQEMNFLQPTPTSAPSSLDVIGQTVRAMGQTTPAPSIPGFQIQELLGQGGMGIVWKARELALNRPVAIKIPLAAGVMAPGVKSRFFREAQAAARLHHPGICQIYQVAESEGRPYLVMPLITGPTLREWIESGRKEDATTGADQSGSVPARLRQRFLAAARIVATLARALACAHDAGIIHRDIKPSNVILSNEDGAPVLMDFGCAKDIQSSDGPASLSGQFIGTPAYMSPEQVNPKLGSIDARSDIYSLGIVLYELLCDQPAFDGPAHEVLSAISTAEPAAPRSLQPLIPCDLETICLKAIAKLPGDRYQTACDLADDLQRFLKGDAISARRASLWDRGLRHWRRNQFSHSVTGIAVMAVVAAVILFWRATNVAHTSELQSRLQQGLEQAAWTLQHAALLDSLTARLREVQPEQAAFFSRRIADRIAEETDQRIRVEELNASEFNEVEEWLQRLETYSPSAAEKKRSEWTRRLSSWSPTNKLAAPYSNLSEFFGDTPMTVTARGLIPRERPSRAVTILPTKVSCEGNAEIRVKINDRWQSSVMGIRLPCREGNYDFVVGTESGIASLEATTSPDHAPRTIAEELKQNGKIKLQIRRKGIVIREEEFAPAGASVDFGLAPMQLVVRRADDQIEMRWQSLHAGPNREEILPVSMKYRDPFPMSTSGDDHWKLLWPEPGALEEIHVLRQFNSSKPNPLEIANNLFTNGAYQDALDHYTDLSHQLKSPGIDVEQELRFKLGLCQARLKQEDEAHQIWASLLDEPGSRWPMVAGCYLWESLLRRQKQKEAESVFLKIASHDSQHELLLLISDDLRSSILKSYLKDSRGLVSLRRDPYRTDNLIQVEGIEELLGASPDQRAWTLWTLFRSAWSDGQTEIAQNRGEKLMAAEAIVPWVSIQFFMEFCAFQRLHGNVGLTLDALNQKLAQKPFPANRGAPHPLLIERARTLAALGDTTSAEKNLDEYFRLVEANKERFYYYGDACLLQGFLHWDRGDQDKAVAAWSEGFAACRLKDRPARVTTEGTELALAGMLGSLSGKMDDEAAAVLMTKVIENIPLSMFSLAMKYSQPIKPETIRTAWKSPRGRELARRFAHRKLSPSEQMSQTATLFGCELIQRGAFQQQTPEQDRLVESLAAQLFDLWSAGKISEWQVSKLAELWKGESFLGNELSIPKDLPESVRGPLAYVVGHRLRFLNRQNDAIRFLKISRDAATSDSTLARLCEQDLAALTLGQPPAKMENVWSPGPRETHFPGLISFPAKLAGVAHWQVTTKLPYGTISCAAWHPMHHWLAVGIGNGEVRVYDRTGDQLELLQLLVGHQSAVASLDWHPSGNMLASTSEDGTVRIWNWDTVSPPGGGSNQHVTSQILRHHEGIVPSAAWSPDGTMLASCDATGAVKLWTTATDTVRTLTKLRHHAWKVHWHPLGDRIAIGDTEGTVQVLKLDGTEAVGPYQATRGEPNQLQFDAEGKRLFATGYQPHLSFHDIPAGENRRFFSSPTAIDVGGAALNRSRNKLAVSGSQFWIWDNWPHDNSPQENPLPYSSAGVVAWSGDGERIALAGRDWGLGEWNTSNRTFTLLLEQCGRVEHLAWSPDGNRLATTSTDGHLRVWTNQGKLLFRKAAHRGAIEAAKWSPDGTRIATGGSWAQPARQADYSLKIWNCESPDDAPVSFDTFSVQIQDLSWTADGQRLVVGTRSTSPSDQLTIYHVSTRHRERAFAGHSEGVHAVACHPADSLVATGGDDRKIILSSINEEKPPVTLVEQLPGPVIGLAWDQDGRRLAFTCQSDGESIGVIEMQSRRVLWRAKAGYRPGKVAWSPDGSKLLVGLTGLLSADNGGTLDGSIAGDASVLAWRGPDATVSFAGNDYRQNIARICNQSQPNRDWSSMNIGNATVSFSAAGEVIDSSPEATDELRYLIERENGTTIMMSHDEFKNFAQNSP